MDAVVAQGAHSARRMQMLPPAELICLLQSAWKILTTTAVIGAAIGVAIGLLLPVSYESSMQLTVVPFEDPTSATAVNILDRASTEFQLFSAVLRSRRAASEVVRRLDLQRAYHVTSPDVAVPRLQQQLSINLDRRSNMITLTARDREPDRAHLILSTLSDVASQLHVELLLEPSRTQRHALEARMAKVGTALAADEDALRQFRETHGIAEMTDQIKASVAEATALERLQIEKQLGLHFLHGFGAEDAAELEQARREAGGIARALGRLTGKGRSRIAPRKRGTQGPLLPLEAVPRLELEHQRLQRAVDLDAAHYTMLSQQVEQLRALEARIHRVGIVDTPSRPRARIWPPRSLVALTGFVTGFLLATMVLVLRHQRQHQR